MPSFSHEFLVELFRVTPPTYSADVVVAIAAAAGGTAAAVIVEVQLAPDPQKRLTWPVYVAALRARLGCPVYLLVVPATEDVARWARAPIELGQPDFRLTPLVMGPSAIPRVVDLAVGRRAPELTVLSALAWRDADVARIAIEVLAGLAEERSRL